MLSEGNNRDALHQNVSPPERGPIVDTGYKLSLEGDLISGTRRGDEHLEL